MANKGKQQANCIDSTKAAEAVFASEIKNLQSMGFKCKEYVTLEPFERDHAVVRPRSRLLAFCAVHLTFSVSFFPRTCRLWVFTDQTSQQKAESLRRHKKPTSNRRQPRSFCSFCFFCSCHRAQRRFRSSVHYCTLSCYVLTRISCKRRF